MQRQRLKRKGEKIWIYPRNKTARACVYAYSCERGVFDKISYESWVGGLVSVRVCVLTRSLVGLTIYRHKYFYRVDSIESIENILTILTELHIIFTKNIQYTYNLFAKFYSNTVLKKY